MKQVAVPIAVANASPEVKTIAVHTTILSGGYGAFREAVAWIIDQQGRTETVLQLMKDRVLNS